MIDNEPYRGGLANQKHCNNADCCSRGPVPRRRQRIASDIERPPADGLDVPIGRERCTRMHQRKRCAHKRREILPVDLQTDISPKTRLLRQQGRFESGRVLLPKEAPWLAEFEQELFGVPLARRDDQVDALLLLLEWFRANGAQVIHVGPIIFRAPRDPMWF
ncbi:MAG: hypothetical protein JO261_15060 [Alphaproteobacteria bacterium]|nr:hypothetical protein [Alphaproteobacteria bacterium]MBV9695016.1 hypothetical protein [Alphaproteobacteria bacterium]